MNPNLIAFSGSLESLSFDNLVKWVWQQMKAGYHAAVASVKAIRKRAELFVEKLKQWADKAKTFDAKAFVNRKVAAAQKLAETLVQNAKQFGNKVHTDAKQFVEARRKQAQAAADRLLALAGAAGQRLLTKLKAAADFAEQLVDAIKQKAVMIVVGAADFVKKLGKCVTAQGCTDFHKMLLDMGAKLKSTWDAAAEKVNDAAEKAAEIVDKAAYVGGCAFGADACKEPQVILNEEAEILAQEADDLAEDALLKKSQDGVGFIPELDPITPCLQDEACQKQRNYGKEVEKVDVKSGSEESDNKQVEKVRCVLMEAGFRVETRRAGGAGIVPNSFAFHLFTCEF